MRPTNTRKILEEFTDPITLEIFQPGHPVVVDQCGHSFSQQTWDTLVAKSTLPNKIKCPLSNKEVSQNTSKNLLAQNLVAIINPEQYSEEQQALVFGTKVTELEKTIVALETQLQNAVNEKTTTDTAIQSLQAKLEETTQGKAEVDHALAMLTKELRKEWSINRQLAADNAQHEEEKDKLHHELKQSQLQLGKASQNNTQLQHELELKQQESTSLQHHINHLQHELTNTRKLLAENQQMLDAQNNEQQAALVSTASQSQLAPTPQAMAQMFFRFLDSAEQRLAVLDGLEDRLLARSMQATTTAITPYIEETFQLKKLNHEQDLQIREQQNKLTEARINQAILTDENQTLREASATNAKRADVAETRAQTAETKAQTAEVEAQINKKLADHWEEEASGKDLTITQYKKNCEAYKKDKEEAERKSLWWKGRAEDLKDDLKDKKSDFNKVNNEKNQLNIQLGDVLNNRSVVIEKSAPFLKKAKVAWQAFSEG